MLWTEGRNIERRFCNDLGPKKSSLTLKTFPTIIQQLCMHSYSAQALHQSLGARCKDKLLVLVKKEADGMLQLCWQEGQHGSKKGGNSAPQPLHGLATPVDIAL